MLLVSIISHIYFSLLRHSALDKEIAYLSCNLSKSSKTYYTKILYTFEYVKNLSRCQLIDQSNAYVERIQIDQFNQRPTVCLFGFFDQKRFFPNKRRNFLRETTKGPVKDLMYCLFYICAWIQSKKTRCITMNCFSLTKQILPKKLKPLFWVI